MSQSANLPTSMFFYCDESSHDTRGYVAIGGIAIRPESLEKLKVDFARLKNEYEIPSNSEIKWEKITRKRLPAYKAMADHFFFLLNTNSIHFHCIVADAHQFNHRVFSQGNKQTTISKMYYQLLKHRCCKFYGRETRVHVRPDNGDCTCQLPSFMERLNEDARERFRIPHNPIASINCEDSKESPVLQLNDIIIGGIASRKNQRHLAPDASAHKTELGVHILKGFGWNNYDSNTAYLARKITLWNYKLQRVVPVSRLSSTATRGEASNTGTD